MHQGLVDGEEVGRGVDVQKEDALWQTLSVFPIEARFLVVLVSLLGFRECCQVLD